MKINFFVAIFLSLSLSLSAQSVKKGFKSLEKPDYAKAKEAFEKNLAENSEHVASNFGMAMLLSTEKSDYFNIVESWQYIMAIEGKTSQLSQEEIEILGEYFMATEVRKTSRPVKKKIDIAIESVEDRLIKYIREENDLEAVYAVLEKYPDFKHYDNVVHIRNQFEYRKYEKMNTMAGYSEFIEKFPDAAQIDKARANQYKMAFTEAKATNTVASYNSYLKNYPNSSHRQQAIKLRNEAAFKAAETKHNLMAYESFISLYPDALQIPQAKKHQHDLMYEKAKRIKSIEAYNEFIRMYPEGAYFIDVFNLKASELGMQNFRAAGLPTQSLVWALALDNNERIEKAQAMAVNTDGSYIIAGTTQENDTAYTNAWLVKINKEGKMVWNTTVGQSFNDEISDVYITSDNKIIVLGYTQATADSASYAAWMFKLNEDGSKVWNKSLGDIIVATSIITATDDIILSTYNNDTIPEHYNLQAINSDGQTEWERDYISTGSFRSINILENNDLLLSGDRWVINTDSKFYIKWEDTLKVDGNFKYADANASQAVIISRDSIQSLYHNYSLAGNKTASVELAFAPDATINELMLLSDNTSLMLCKEGNASSIKKFDASGNIITEKKILGGLEVVDVIKNSSGGISLLLKGTDYVVINYSAVVF